VFALLMASRALDNRFVPALIALIPAVIWGVLTNIFALWGVITYYQPVVYGGLALICLAVAFICRYEKPMEEHAEK
jgi:ribose/xylose/arabinose/galactoside ABC-type transport system permease subunit